MNRRLIAVLKILGSNETLLDGLLVHSDKFKKWNTFIQPNRDLTQQDFDTQVNEFKARFKPEFINDKLKIYRVVEVEDIESIDFEKVGVSWTWEKNALDDSQDWGGDDPGDKSNWFVLIGSIAVKDIDLEKTFLLNTTPALNIESEVHPKRNKPIFIHQVYKYKNNKIRQDFKPPLKAKAIDPF